MAAPAGAPYRVPMGTLIVGYVPTAQGEAALATGIEEARRRGHRLVVVNTARGGEVSGPLVVQGEARSRLDAVLAASGLEHEVRQPLRGREPAEEIADAADETNADLVVIGMRHRTPVGKLILGSVAQQILLEVSCPVLAVKASYAKD